VFAIAYLAVFIVVGMLRIGDGILADEDSAYSFAAEAMERFERRQRLAQSEAAARQRPYSTLGVL
jgi:hypothetical protein